MDAAGCVCKELILPGGGVWGGLTKGRSFKLDIPSAKFWVTIFFLGRWVSEPKDPPLPPSYKQSLGCRPADASCVVEVLHRHIVPPDARPVAGHPTLTVQRGATCYLGMQSAEIGNLDIILGDVWIRKFYTVYDAGRQRYASGTLHLHM